MQVGIPLYRCKQNLNNKTNKRSAVFNQELSKQVSTASIWVFQTKGGTFSRPQKLFFTGALKTRYQILGPLVD